MNTLSFYMINYKLLLVNIKMTNQTIIQRNQIWHHYKGTKYKIYGLANYKDYVYVLYYQSNTNYLRELKFGGGYVINTETLQKMLMIIEDIYKPLDSLIIKDSKPNHTYTEEEVYQLKNNGHDIIWARPINNFLEKITLNNKNISRFQLFRVI